MEQKSSQHRFDLNWLRVIAILAVFLFQYGRFFDTSGWHVKNPITYPGMDYFTGILGCWIMSIIFLISGASLFYGLGSLLAKPGAVALLAVPDTLLFATLNPRGYAGIRDFGNWPLGSAGLRWRRCASSRSH